MCNFAVSFQKDSKGDIQAVNYLSTDFKQFIKQSKKVTELNGITFENIKVTKSKISGTNGSIDRYTDKSIIILCRTIKEGEKGFCISNAHGQIKFCSEKEAVNISKTAGIANGKLVSNSFVSSIKGDYKLVEQVIFNSNKEEKKSSTASQPSKPKKLTGYREGMLILKKYAPKNLKNLVSCKRWDTIERVWASNLENHKQEFDNCVLSYEKAIELIDSISASSLKYDNFFAQILKALVIGEK